MARKILVGLDGGAAAERILPVLDSLFPGSRLTLLRAWAPAYAGAELGAPDAAILGEMNDRIEAGASEYLERIARRLKGRPRTRVALGSGAAALAEAVREERFDLVAIAGHGGAPIRRRLVGGTTEGLIHHSDAPLLVVPGTAPRRRGAGRLRRIAVPLDGGKEAEGTLPAARALAKERRAELVLVHVLQDVDRLAWQSGIWGGALPERAAADRFRDGARRIEGAVRDRLEALVKAERRAGVRARAVIVPGLFPDALHAAVRKQGCGLMVFQVHPHGVLEHLLNGSATSRILQDAEVPALLLRKGRRSR